MRKTHVYMVCVSISLNNPCPSAQLSAELARAAPFPLPYFEEPHRAAINCPSSICTNLGGPWGLLWFAVPLRFVYFAFWLHLGLL